MQTIEASFIINTPMFLGGADPKKTAEIRISSIKSAIRFWWRALAYARHDGDLTRMKAEEDRIFGSTSGQAEVRFLLKSTEPPTTNASDELEGARSNLGLRYLGYGVIESFDGANTRAGRLVRPCINADFSFTLQLLTKKIFDPTLLDALQLFGLIGCLGSRARKGYGSVTLLSYKTFKNKIEEDQYVNPPLAEYKNKINSLLNNNKVDELDSCPEISAFYQQTPIFQLNKGTDATELLSHYGLMMLRYRSAGRSGRINDNLSNTNFNSEERFMDDHDWHKDKYIKDWRDNNSGFHPERVAFGLPHSYFSNVKNKRYIKNEVNTQSKKYGRRASPLFFHVHKLPNNSYVGIALILKSDFLPSDEQIKADDKNVPQNINYKILSDFITGFKRDIPDVDSNTHYFPNHIQIHPQENNQ